MRMVVKFESLLKDIRSKNIKPVYVLAGEETYFIDAIVKEIEQNVLTPDEKEFNQTVVYGKDIDVNTLMSECKVYPMMSERRVVIVKEAAGLAGFDKLLPYLKSPIQATVLVIALKYKSLDMRQQAAKVISSSNDIALLEAGKLAERDIVPWIRNYAETHKIQLDIKAAEYLKELVGADLNKTVNELDKLSILVGPENTITHEHVLDNIGLSREFNVFELQKALATRNLKRTVAIATHLGNNKNVSILALLPTLYTFFTRGLLIKYEMGVHKKSFDDVCAQLKIFYSAKSDMQDLVRNYSVAQLKTCIREIGIADLYTKGVNAPDLEEAELLRNMVLKFLY